MRIKKVYYAVRTFLYLSSLAGKYSFIRPPVILFDELETGILGRHVIDKTDLRRYVIIDLDQVKSIEQLKDTVAHEFRHIWQSYTIPAEEFEYWAYFAKDRSGGYKYSAVEIDARVFERTEREGLKAMGTEIFDKIRPCLLQNSEANQLLKRCKEVAREYWVE